MSNNNVLNPKQDASQESLEIQRLWKKYKETPSEENIRILYVGCQNLINSIIKKSLKNTPPHEQENIRTEAISEVGLRFTQVLKTYQETENGALFSTFFGIHINGATHSAIRAAFQSAHGLNHTDARRYKTITDIRKQYPQTLSVNEVAQLILANARILEQQQWKRETHHWNIKTLTIEIHLLEALVQGTVSLNHTPDNTAPLHGSPPDTGTLSPEQIFTSELYTLHQAAERLPQKQREIFKQRVGEEQSFERIGRDVNLTEGRTCRIFNVVIPKELKMIIDTPQNKNRQRQAAPT